MKKLIFFILLLFPFNFLFTEEQFSEEDIKAIIEDINYVQKMLSFRSSIENNIKKCASECVYSQFNETSVVVSSIKITSKYIKTSNKVQINLKDKTHSAYIFYDKDKPEDLKLMIDTYIHNTILPPMLLSYPFHNESPNVSLSKESVIYIRLNNIDLHFEISASSEYCKLYTIHNYEPITE